MSIRIAAATANLSRTAGLPPVAAVTMMGWFRLAVDRNSFTNFMYFGNVAATGYNSLATLTDGTTLSASTQGSDTTGQSLAVGRWYHLAVTVAGTGAGQFLVYVDGVLDITASGNSSASAGTIIVGNEPNATDFLNGDVAAMGVWDAALSVQEIRQQMPFGYPVVRADKLNSFSPLRFSRDVYDLSQWQRAWTPAGTLTTDQDPPQVRWAPRVRSRAFAFAGITFDAAGNSGDVAAASSWSGSASWNGTDRMLAVDVSMLGPGVTVTAMTYGGTACTLVGSKSTITSFGSVESWRILQSAPGSPAAGSNTLSVTLSGSIEFSVEWVSYAGVHQTSPTESYNSAQATNVGAANATVTVTPAADGTWIHGAVVASDTSITAGQTSRNNVSGTLGSGADEDAGPISPAAGTTISYTGVGAAVTWAIGGYAIRPVSASVLASTYTATVAAAVGAATSAAVVTFTKPTYTAIVAATVAPVTSAVTATFTKPTYSTTVAASVGHATSAATATFVKPTYAAAVGASVGPAVASASSTFSPGTHTASGAMTVTAATSSAAVTFVKPTYTSAVSALVGSATSTASATFVKPTYHATVVAATGMTTAATSASFVKPTYSVTVIASAGGTVSLAAASFSPGTHTAIVAASVGPASASATTAFVKPTYSSVTTATVGHAVASATATFVRPSYTASSSAQVGGATIAAASAFVKPSYAATVVAMTGHASAAASATFASGTPTAVVGCSVGGAFATLVAAVVDPTPVVPTVVGVGGSATKRWWTRTEPNKVKDVETVAIKADHRKMDNVMAAIMWYMA